MLQPEGFEDSSKPHHVCRLNKALYDLKQAPQSWFDRLKIALLDWGFTNSVSDTSLFHYKINNKLLLALVYVDDILITGEDSNWISKLITNLDSQFSLKTLGAMNYFLGIEAYRNSKGLVLTEKKIFARIVVQDKHKFNKNVSFTNMFQ